MRLMRPAEIPCQQVVELISDYLEDALPVLDRRRLEHHLTGCPHCSAYLAQMRETLRLTGRLVPEDLSPEMQREFSDVYRRWRSED
ncbi:MAG TPA: anti-sigma factor [Solirubrobacteraceae bacterium]|jgi:anti-sigma factor RsiW|nr:anti-sigma factor [Solirubrobacteraceae bacterium]